MTTGETRRVKDVERQFARANNGILAGSHPELHTMNTENDTEMKTEAEKRTLHRMPKVHNFSEMWHGSQNILATQKESREQIKQMTAVGCMSDTEEMVNAFWSLFQHDGEAAFKLSQRFTFQPSLSAKDLPGGRTQLLNARRNWKINCHPVKSDDDSAPGTIFRTEDWLNWNGDLDNPNDSEEDGGADVESDIEQDNSIEDPGCAGQRDVSAMSNVPWLNRPTRKAQSQAEQVVMWVNAMERRRNKGVKQMYDRMGQCFTSFFMYLELQS